MDDRRRDPGDDKSDTSSSIEGKAAETGRGNAYEPKDSRNVTGTAHTPDGRWSGGEDVDQQPGGDYEPRDSRNVTGTAKTEDGRWTNDTPKRAPGDN